MKIKIFKGNDLNKLEMLINNFLDEVKVENVEITSYNKDFICLITYYDKI